MLGFFVGFIYLLFVLFSLAVQVSLLQQATENQHLKNNIFIKSYKLIALNLWLGLYLTKWKLEKGF